MRDVLVEARRPCPVPLPGLRYESDRQGEPIVTRETTWHGEGTIFAVPEDRAAEMKRLAHDLRC